MVQSRLAWRRAELVARRDETATAATLVLGVPEWPGHLAGQHVDVRLTAPDGYSTQRSYSLAAPDHGARIELTVQVVADGEVSPFLARDLAAGDPVELRGPIGGWFVWRPGQPQRVLLLAGGSGVVPLMAMVRARHESGSRAPMHLVYSVRTPADVFYADELQQRADQDDGLRVSVVHTRQGPAGSDRAPHRLDAAGLAALVWPAEPQRGTDVLTFVCGPTGFVDAVSDALVSLGHDPGAIRTERYG
jgi:ferredoxin-NADP reductase